MVSRAGTWLQFAHLMDERWQASDLGKDAVSCHGHWGTTDLQAKGCKVSLIDSPHLRDGFSPCHRAREHLKHCQEFLGGQARMRHRVTPSPRTAAGLWSLSPSGHLSVQEQLGNLP